MFRKISGGFILVACLWLVTTISASAITRLAPVEVEVPDTTVTISGRTSPFALVSIREGSATLATTSADNEGSYTTTLASQPNGLRTVTVFSDDVLSTRSATNTQTFSVQPQQNTEVTYDLAPTLVRRTPFQVNPGSIVQLSGYTLPNSLITLNVADAATLDSSSNDAGFFEFLLSTDDFGPGQYTAQAIVVSPNGIPQSNSVQFEVLSSEDATVDIVVDPSQLPPPITLQPEGDATIQGNAVTVRGEAVPNAQIVIYADGVVVGSTFADAAGNWSFIYTAAYSPVALSFEACIEGRCSVLSTTLRLSFPNLKTIPPCAAELNLEQYRFWGVAVEENVKLTLQNDLNEGVVLGVNWGDGAVEQFDYETEMSPLEIVKAYAQPGTYNGTVQLLGQESCAARYFSVGVVNGDSDSFDDVFLIFILVVLFGSLVYLERRDKQASVQKP